MYFFLVFSGIWDKINKKETKRLDIVKGEHANIIIFSGLRIVRFSALHMRQLMPLGIGQNITRVNAFA